jgi:hypothetical protein
LFALDDDAGPNVWITWHAAGKILQPHGFHLHMSEAHTSPNESREDNNGSASQEEPACTSCLQQTAGC